MQTVKGYPGHKIATRMICDGVTKNHHLAQYFGVEREGRSGEDG
jgi:hypothetical protein